VHKIILHAIYNAGFKGEELYAEQLTDNTARIITMPFSDQVCGWGDVVEFEEKEITKVLDSTYRVYYFSYRDDGDFELIVEHFRKHGIVAEVLVGNYFGIAVPNEIDDDELAPLIESCPVLINVRNYGSYECKKDKFKYKSCRGLRFGG